MSLTVLDDLTPSQEPEERQPDPDGEDDENITQANVPRDKVTDLYDNFVGITSHKSSEKETDACSTDHLQKPEDKQTDSDGKGDGNITEKLTDKNARSDDDGYVNTEKNAVKKLDVPGDDGYVKFSEVPVETLDVTGDDGCVKSSEKPEDKQTDSDGKGDGNITEKLTDKNARSDDDGYVNTEKNPVEKLDVPGDDGYVKSSEGPLETLDVTGDDGCVKPSEKPEDKQTDSDGKGDGNITEKLTNKNARSDDHGYVNTEKKPEDKQTDSDGKDDGNITEKLTDKNANSDDHGYVNTEKECETIQTAAAGYIAPIPEPRDGKVDPDGYLIPSPEIKTEQPEDATPQAPTEEKPIYDYTTKSQEINRKPDHNDVTTPDADPKKPVYDYATTQQNQRPRQNDVLRYVDSRKGHRNGQPVPPIVNSMKQPIDDNVYDEIDDVRRSQAELRTDYRTTHEGSAIVMVPSLTPLCHQTILQRLKKYLWGNLTIVGVIVAVIVIASLIGVIIALIVIPKPPPTEAPTTTSNQPESSTMETTSYPPGYKYCQHNTPCKNGGTCVDLPGFKYVCVCPHCLCSTAKPFGDCIINKATICKTEDLPPGKLVPHPYLCIKFYSCHPNATLRREQFVYKYADGNHVFNPATELSDYPEKVACAKQEVIELCADIACANGGTCQDTASGFMCECVPGYKGRKCEIVK